MNITIQCLQCNKPIDKDNIDVGIEKWNDDILLVIRFWCHHCGINRVVRFKHYKI